METSMDTALNNSIADSVKDILNKMMANMDYDEEIRPSTWLVADLGFESIDIVVLGTTIQQQLNDNLPFTEYLSQIGQREIRDISFDELVAFVETHTGQSHF
jgi:acyl carrier protein